MSEDVKQTLASNPSMTYGQAVGYSMGFACGKMNRREGGLSASDWTAATDDYAHGYRAGYKAAKAQEVK